MDKVAPSHSFILAASMRQTRIRQQLSCFAIDAIEAPSLRVLLNNS